MTKEVYLNVVGSEADRVYIAEHMAEIAVGVSETFPKDADFPIATFIAGQSSVLALFGAAVEGDSAATWFSRIEKAIKMLKVN